MDSWPSDDRDYHATTAERKGKNKSKDGIGKYTSVIQGSLHAITLSERKNRFEWISVVKKENSSLNHLRMGNYFSIFPPTRTPSHNLFLTTTSRHAEQEANFLRTYHPDVDIPAELIRDLVAQDARLVQGFKHFDPYAGNLLEPVFMYNSSMAEPSAFLAYPTGGLNRDLGFSPLHYMDQNQISFKPVAAAARTFETPIQQIITSKGSSVDFKQDSHMAVRTFGHTSLFKLTMTAESSQRPQMTELASIKNEDVGNRSPVDIKLSSSPFEALVVNDHGAIYRYTLANGHKSIDFLYPATSDDIDAFWRVAHCGNGIDYLLASGKMVQRLDLRANTPLNLFKVPRQGDYFTSVEDPGENNIIRLSSTQDILWIDKRFTQKPLLCCKHNRNYDRSIEVRTVNSTLSLLTSRNNSMVTVYDVSRSAGQLYQLNNSPYCLLPGQGVGVGTPYQGQAFFRHPLALTKETINMSRLFDNGSIRHCSLHFPLSTREDTLQMLSSSDVDSLASSLIVSPNPMDSQDYSETNLSLPYNNMFRVYTEEKRQKEENLADAVFDVLGRIPSFWKNIEAPVESMLTTYDIFFRLGEEPLESSRADFLSETAINSKRGSRALVQGLLTTKPLTTDASWHSDIAPILMRLDSDFVDHGQSWPQTLQQHNLTVDSGRMAQSIRRETEAAEQLALDLSLSSNIYSAQPFLDHHALELESMTKTLSLAGGPPNVDFGYLRPVSRGDADHYTKLEAHDFVAAIGVRMVLNRWEIGTHAEDFAFRDLYDGVTDPQTIGRRKLTPTKEVIATQSQRPPLVVTSSVPSDGTQVITFPLLRGHSNKTLGSQPPLVASNGPESSQEHMANTQILPGPYGGRSLGKKKMAKKRLGGF